MFDSQSYEEIRAKILSDHHRGRYTVFDYLKAASRLTAEELIVLTDIPDEIMRRQFMRGLTCGGEVEEFRKSPRIWKKATISIR